MGVVAQIVGVATQKSAWSEFFHAHYIYYTLCPGLSSHKLGNYVKGGEGASDFHRVAHSMHVLGKVLKSVFPYLEHTCTADAVHSRLLCTSHTPVPAD